MADQEHVERLLTGVLGWNRWWLENPGMRPDLREADLQEADLRRANLQGANLQGANLQGAYLSGAYLSGAYLRNANLQGADLLRIDLTGADLRWAKLQGADLSRASLSRADFEGANLEGANLEGAKLQSTKLQGSKLQDANLSQARISYTVFGAIDFRGVQGLANVIHEGPSTIGLDTIERSQGHIPESFLRGCGVSDRLIDYIPSLTTQPIQFYSCFISYTSKDEALAQRLYADLQAAGVRCWYAPEKLKIGDSIIAEIDQAIRLHEKLLIILSESSVASAWVEREVRAAQARELREHRPVLFPIRLDAAVERSTAGWAAELWEQRKIGDFCAWHDYAAYQQSFARLLRDLQATPDR